MSEDSIKNEAVTKEAATAKDEAATARNEEISADTLEQVSGGQQESGESSETKPKGRSRAWLRWG